MKPLALLSFIIFTFWPFVAFAKQANVSSGAKILKTVEIEKSSDLNFGTIVADAFSAGKVEVLHNQAEGSVCSQNITCFGGAKRAEFKITGTPNQQVSVNGPTSVTLQNIAGDTMQVDAFAHATEEASAVWRGWEVIGETGVESLNIGAVLNVNPGQPGGTYTGIFTVTVEYQ